MGGEHARVERLKELLMHCRVTPGMRASEIRRKCVMMGVTTSKLDSYLAILVDAKLLLQIPEYEPFQTSVWTLIPNAKHDEAKGKYVYTDHPAEPNTEEGRKHYHWVYRVPEEASE